MWDGQGFPNPRFPPLTPFPSLSHPPPASHPFRPHTSIPLEYFSRTNRKQTQVISSYNLSSQCMDYYQRHQSFDCRTVCLFVPPFICLFVLEFYNLVNGPVDNIVVKPSRVRGETEKEKEDRIDEREKKCNQPSNPAPAASIAGLCPTITQINKTVSYPAPSPYPTAKCRRTFILAAMTFTRTFIFTHGMS